MFTVYLHKLQKSSAQMLVNKLIIQLMVSFFVHHSHTYAFSVDN